MIWQKRILQTQQPSFQVLWDFISKLQTRKADGTVNSHFGVEEKSEEETSLRVEANLEKLKNNKTKLKT